MPSVDSTPDRALLLHLEEWFGAHPLNAGQTIQGEKVFQSPRHTMTLVILKDPVPAIGKHLHTSTDEIIVVLKGKGEMLINGEWRPVNAGDLHVCPRGIPHATRTVGDGEMWMIAIVTPPQPAGGHDRVMVE